MSDASDHEAEIAPPTEAPQAAVAEPLPSAAWADVLTTVDARARAALETWCADGAPSADSLDYLCEAHNAAKHIPVEELSLCPRLRLAAIAKRLLDVLACEPSHQTLIAASDWAHTVIDGLGARRASSSSTGFAGGDFGWLSAIRKVFCADVDHRSCPDVADISAVLAAAYRQPCADITREVMVAVRLLNASLPSHSDLRQKGAPRILPRNIVPCILLRDQLTEKTVSSTSSPGKADLAHVARGAADLPRKRVLPRSLVPQSSPLRKAQRLQMAAAHDNPAEKVRSTGTAACASSRADAAPAAAVQAATTTWLAAAKGSRPAAAAQHCRNLAGSSRAPARDAAREAVPVVRAFPNGWLPPVGEGWIRPSASDGAQLVRPPAAGPGSSKRDEVFFGGGVRGDLSGCRRWTYDEERRLIDGYMRYGPRWEPIRKSCKLEQFSGLQLRAKYRNLVGSGVFH